MRASEAALTRGIGWGCSEAAGGDWIGVQRSPGTLTLTLTRTEYWDRAGGERNITFKAFCDFRRAKIAYNGLKTGSFHLFMHPKRSSYHSRKTRF